jgi:hypothetical protein
MKGLRTASVPRANVRALGDEFSCNTRLVGGCRHMEGGIALVYVVPDVIEEIRFGAFSCRAMRGAFFRQYRRSIKQADGSRAVAGNDGFHQYPEGIGFQFLSPWIGTPY